MNWTHFFHWNKPTLMPKFNHVDVSSWFKPVNLEAVTYSTGDRFYFEKDAKEKVYYPSVTTVLKDYKKGILDAWRKRVGLVEAEKIGAKARIRGEAFHTMTENYIANMDPKDFLDNFSPEHRRTFNQSRRLIDTNINNIHVQEKALLSKSLGIAGRVDLIAEWKGKLSVIDFKGSNKIKKESYIDNYFMQASGYAAMYYEMTGIAIKQIVIIISGDCYSIQTFCQPSTKFLGKLEKEISKYVNNFLELSS